MASEVFLRLGSGDFDIFTAAGHRKPSIVFGVSDFRLEKEEDNRGEKRMAYRRRVRVCYYAAFTTTKVSSKYCESTLTSEICLWHTESAY